MAVVMDSIRQQSVLLLETSVFLLETGVFLLETRQQNVRLFEQVIDYCAGNGGKTLALAALLANNGTVIAHDVDERRLRQLEGSLPRAGAERDFFIDNLLVRYHLAFSYERGTPVAFSYERGTLVTLIPGQARRVWRPRLSRACRLRTPTLTSFSFLRLFVY